MATSSSPSVQFEATRAVFTPVGTFPPQGVLNGSPVAVGTSTGPGFSNEIGAMLPPAFLDPTPSGGPLSSIGQVQSLDPWLEPELPDLAEFFNFTNIDSSTFNADLWSESYDMGRFSPGLPAKVRQPIHQAAQNGHQETVERLLRARPDCCDIRAEKGETPFWLAAQGGSVGVAKVLADAGADINVVVSTASQRRPIHQAAQNGHLKMVQFLLERNVIVDAVEEDGATALWLACQEGYTEIVKLLLDAGANPSAETVQSGCRPLHQACQNGHLETVKLLVSRGVSIDYGGKKGATGLWLACQQGHTEIVRYLMELGANTNVRSVKSGRAPLHQACQNGHDAVVWLLLRSFNVEIDVAEEDGVTPLWLACQQGHTEIVKRLLELGANPDATSIQSRRSTLHQASQNGNEEIVSLLLEKGVNVDFGEEDGATPLWLAAQQGYTNILNLFLSKGANPNVKSVKNSRSPLHQAAQNGHLNAIVTLLRHGAIPDLVEEDGWSPLLLACQQGHIDIVSALLDSGAEINLQEKDGATGLWLAAQQGHTAVVKLLLDRGAKQLATFDAQRMPIHQAAQNNRLEALKLLVEGGADINCRSNSSEQDGGITPLWLASQGGHVAILDYLIEKGAEVVIH